MNGFLVENGDTMILLSIVLHYASIHLQAGRKKEVAKEGMLSPQIHPQTKKKSNTFSPFHNHAKCMFLHEV